MCRPLCVFQNSMELFRISNFKKPSRGLTLMVTNKNNDNENNDEETNFHTAGSGNL
jgi:hypothetical protein